MLSPRVIVIQLFVMSVMSGGVFVFSRSVCNSMILSSACVLPNSRYAISIGFELSSRMSLASGHME